MGGPGLVDGGILRLQEKKKERSNKYKEVKKNKKMMEGVKGMIW